MNRRDFLRRTTGVAVATAIAPLIPASPQIGISRDVVHASSLNWECVTDGALSDIPIRLGHGSATKINEMFWQIANREQLA